MAKKEEGEGMSKMMFGMFHKPIMEAMSGHPVFKSIKKHLLGEETEDEDDEMKPKKKWAMPDRTSMPKEDRKNMAIMVMKKKMNGNEE